MLKDKASIAKAFCNYYQNIANDYLPQMSLTNGSGPTTNNFNHASLNGNLPQLTFNSVSVDTVHMLLLKLKKTTKSEYSIPLIYLKKFSYILGTHT